MGEATDLIPTKDLTPTVVFAPGGVDPILTEIEERCRAFVPDLSTGTSRKEIASMASRVARSKTFLDDMGKSLNAGHREKINAVDAVRRKVRDRLDALKAEVRKPLTDWEDAEAAREARIKGRISDLKELADIGYGKPSDLIRERIRQIEAVAIDDSFEDMISEANAIKAQCLTALRAALADAEAREEGDRLRAAEAERLAKEEAERKEREAAEQAEREAREREEREQRLAEQAAAAERDRIEREKREAAAEEARRAADEKHRNSVNADAEAVIAKLLGGDEHLAKRVVHAIARDEIPHVEIKY